MQNDLESGPLSQSGGIRDLYLLLSNLKQGPASCGTTVKHRMATMYGVESVGLVTVSQNAGVHVALVAI